MTTRDQLGAALVAVVWGLNFVVIDWGMRDVPPLLFVALRFALIAFPLVLLVPRPAVSWRVLAGVGGFMSLGQFGLLYTAIGLGMAPGLVALVLQAQVILTIVVAAGVLKDVPTAAQLAGVLLGTAGLVVVGLGRGGDAGLLGLVVTLGAALSWAFGNVLVRATGAPGGLGLTVWSATVVPVPALLLGLLVDGPTAMLAGLDALGPRALVSTAYTVVLASLLGYGIFTRLLARYPGAAVVPWVLLAPVVALLAGWALLGQRPALLEVVGGAMLLAGALVAVVRRPAIARTTVVGGATVGG